MRIDHPIKIRKSLSMARWPGHLTILCFCVLITGCLPAAHVSTLYHREVGAPFSKMLIVYVDKEIYYTGLDSESYSNELEPAFLDPNNLDIEAAVEKWMPKALAAPGTSFIRASDYFKPGFSSFNDFTRETEKSGVGAILLILNEGNENTVTFGNTVHQSLLDPNAHTSITKSTNETFGCHLVGAHDHLSIWDANLTIDGVENEKRESVVHSVVKGLKKVFVERGYLAR